jgi:nicotinamide riboside kinase
MGGKVAFIGTHGVGKTVLTFSLASRLRAMGVDADVAHENSRRSPFPINEATTLDGQMWIQAAQWQAELEAARRAALVICDRAVLDNYAYMVRACGEQEWLHPFLKRWSQTYDALFLVPIIDAAITADRMRATSAAFQREIHELVVRLVDRFELGDRVVPLPSDRDQHVPLVITALQRLKLIPRRRQLPLRKLS